MTLKNYGLSILIMQCSAWKLHIFTKILRNETLKFSPVIIVSGPIIVPPYDLKLTTLTICREE